MKKMVLMVCVLSVVACMGITCKSDPCSKVCEAACGFVAGPALSVACLSACKSELVSQKCNTWVSENVGGKVADAIDWVKNLLSIREKVAVKKAAAMAKPEEKVVAKPEEKKAPEPKKEPVAAPTPPKSPEKKPEPPK